MHIHTHEQNKKNKEIYFIGDFNMNLLKSDDHRDTEIFYETFSANHFLPILRVQLELLPLLLPLLRTPRFSDPAIIVDVTSDPFPILAWIDLKPFMINL